MAKFDAVALTAVSGVAVPIFQSLVDSSGRVLGLFGKSLDRKTKQLVYQASGEYANRYAKRHGNLKVLGMRQPIDLAIVYTGVGFWDEADLRRYESLEAIEQSSVRGTQPPNGTTQSGVEVANAQPYLMVLGEPGTGKSTFLRKIGYDALAGKESPYRHNCIPVFLELKEFGGDTFDLESAIVREFEICGFPQPEAFVSLALEQGKLLILLDGWDELASESVNATIGYFENFVDRFDKNRYICSCRAAVYRHNFKRFTDVVLAPFEETQVREFIDRWFEDNPDIAASFWAELQKPENAGLKELAHTPLLLTFLGWVYRQEGLFPQNRAVLYRDVLGVLLKEWSAHKRIDRESVYPDVSLATERSMLAEIAYRGFVQNRRFFSQGELVQQISAFLSEQPNTPETIDGDAALEIVVAQQGILVERSRDIFSFSHLALQTYLTAQYLAERDDWEEILEAHLDEPRWWDISIVLAGLLQDKVDLLLDRLERNARSHLTPKLTELLRWVDTTTRPSAGNFRLEAKRAAAVFLTRSRNLAIASDDTVLKSLELVQLLDERLGNALEGNTTDRVLSIDRARTFEVLQILSEVNWKTLIRQLEALESQVPTSAQSAEARRAFRDLVVPLWYDALKLDRSCIELSDPDLSAFNHYLDLNLLLARCRRSAGRVSDWDSIASQILK
ncbi:MAG: NACHT domain-containing protein [Cyanobacteria bacterium SBC]|nr:NACHT domain-containing protein [Cyanobacteria bacterium SBC]